MTDYTTVRDALAAYATAVENENRERAERELDAVENAYDEIEAAESIRFRRVVAARDNPDIDLDVDDGEALNQYAKANAGAELMRGSVLMEGGFYITYPEEVDATDVVDRAQTLRDKEKTLADLDERVEPVVDDVQLSSLPVITTLTAPESPHPKGEPADIEVTVANAGDEPTSQTTVLSSPADRLSPASVDLGALSPGDSRSVTFEVSTEQTGEVDGTISIDGVESESQEISDFEVIEKATFVEDAINAVESMRETIDEEAGRRAQSNLDSKLQIAAKALDRAEESLESGHDRHVNSHLRTASKLLGAFLNTLDHSSDLSPELQERLANSAQAIIEDLAVAKRASI